MKLTEILQSLHEERKSLQAQVARLTTAIELLSGQTSTQPTVPASKKRGRPLGSTNSSKSIVSAARKLLVATNTGLTTQDIMAHVNRNYQAVYNSMRKAPDIIRKGDRWILAPVSNVPMNFESLHVRDTVGETKR